MNVRLAIFRRPILIVGNKKIAHAPFGAVLVLKAADLRVRVHLFAVAPSGQS